MTDFGLTKEEIKSIQNVFTNFEDIKTVTIYGSRAKGTQKPASDIDITLKGQDINLELQKKT